MSRPAALIGGLAALVCAGAAPASAQFVPSWDGFYIGLTAGYARSKSDIRASDLAIAGITSPASISGLASNGAGFGLGGGFNWQAGALVYGLEGDWSRFALRTDIPFAGTIAPFGAVSGTLGTDLNWIASARARAGFAVGQALLFGTAGLAVARARGEIVIHGLGAPIAYSDRALLAGWTVGAGIEYALSPTWTIKGEILRTHLGAGVFSSASASVPLSSSIDLFHLRGGLNYKF